MMVSSIPCTAAQTATQPAGSATCLAASQPCGCVAALAGTAQVDLGGGGAHAAALLSTLCDRSCDSISITSVPACMHKSICPSALLLTTLCL